MSVARALPHQPTLVRRDWKPLYWLTGGLLLLVLQLLAGTMPLFAALVFCFLVVTYLTLRILGGVQTLTGLCVAVLAMQHVIISQIAKVIFWEPADVPLYQPVVTMGTYVVGMTGICLAAWLAARLGSPKFRPLFRPELDSRRLFWIAIICVVFGAARSAVLAKGGGGTISTIGFLSPLAVACGTANAVLSTQGRRSLSPLNLIAMLLPFLFGLLGAQREEMSTPIITYFLTCWAFGFRFRAVHFLTVAAAAVAAQLVLFPFAGYARGLLRQPKLEDNVRIAAGLVQEQLTEPAKMKMQEDDAEARALSQAPASSFHFDYYGRPVANLGRYSVIISSDAIVDATLRQGTTGTETIAPGFEMLLPRVLDENKPEISTSPILAHRADGLIGKYDYTTGITLGFFCDSFSSFSWLGVLTIPFLLAFALFMVFRLLLQDSLRWNVYTVAFAFPTAWGFSEGTIQMVMGNILQGAVILVTVLTAIRLLAALLMRPRATDLVHIHEREWRRGARPALSTGAVRQTIQRRRL